MITNGLYQTFASIKITCLAFFSWDAQSITVFSNKI